MDIYEDDILYLKFKCVALNSQVSIIALVLVLLDIGYKPLLHKRK